MRIIKKEQIGEYESDRTFCHRLIIIPSVYLTFMTTDNKFNVRLSAVVCM